MALFRPSQRLASVTDIDLDALESAGIRGLLVDLDNTLLPRDTSVIPPAVEAWITSVSARFRVCLVSNNWHHRVQEVAGELGLPLVAKAIKPLPFAFIKAMRMLGLRRSQCAVIGDQLFTDVIGGNLLGTLTIMVDPLSHADLIHTLLLRRLEARIMKEDRATRAARQSKDATCE
jgi:HAD superfamily phosphatase (TIGR01668 family)